MRHLSAAAKVSCMRPTWPPSGFSSHRRLPVAAAGIATPMTCSALHLRPQIAAGLRRGRGREAHIAALGMQQPPHAAGRGRR